MFANLKNKIKEEIGSDVSTVIRSVGSVRNLSKHISQTGSISSVSGSQISLDGSREDNTAFPSPSIFVKENSFDLKLGDGTPLSTKDIKRLQSREDEWRKRLQKKEAEMMKKIEKQEEEYRIKMVEKEKEWIKMNEKHKKEKAKLIEDILRIETDKVSLETALNNAEEYKKKLYSFQENAQQMEGFQTQEMAKIKHLLLAKEQEVEEKSQQLKNSLSEIENLKTELSKLRNYEDGLNNVQDEMESLRHSTQREKAQLSSQLAQTEEKLRHLKEKVFVLEQRISFESEDQVPVDDRIADLMHDRTLLERKLEEAHIHLSDIKTSWSGKISSLETQVGRLSRQAGEEGLERRRVEQEKERLKQRVKKLESEVETNNMVMATKDSKLLRMAEDIDEMATELKELRANVDDEIEEFKRQIDHSSNEFAYHKYLLEETIKELAIKESKLIEIQSCCEKGKSKNLWLQLKADRLKEELESDNVQKVNLNLNLEKVRTEKDSALLKIALISQKIQMAKKENKVQELENTGLQNNLEKLEEMLKNKNKALKEISERLEEALQKIQEFEKLKRLTESLESKEKALRTSVLDLEEQLHEKNKTIKLLQQRLADIKKTLQRELRVPSSSLDSDAEPTAAILNPSSSKTITTKHSNTREDDVNFKYLKHVLIKFLTSREYEALHLTRAVATLLHFSPDEERLLQETLEWKMSWFGTRPNLGIGQTAKAIPPS